MTDHRKDADERFAHGLLSSLHQDDPRAQEQRIQRLMQAIDAETAQPRRGVWIAAATAACLLAIVLGVVLTRGPGASEIVQRAILAEEGGGGRRYDISAFVGDDSETQVMAGQLDVGGQGHALLRAQAHGDRIVAGRGPDGLWQVDASGTVEQLHAEQLPPWLRFGEANVLMNSLDHVLKRLHHHHALRSGGKTTLRRHGDRVLKHVVAHSRHHHAHEPAHVELWIDADTDAVYRVEFSWTAHALHGDHTTPARLVLELADRPDFPPGWFRSGTHIED